MKGNEGESRGKETKIFTGAFTLRIQSAQHFLVIVQECRTIQVSSSHPPLSPLPALFFSFIPPFYHCSSHLRFITNFVFFLLFIYLFFWYIFCSSEVYNSCYERIHLFPVYLCELMREGGDGDGGEEGEGIYWYCFSSYYSIIIVDLPRASSPFR